MTKYRAKVDVPPGIKAGDIVDFQEPLVPSYASRFEPYNEPAEKEAVINPSRDELKARATELDITFAPNIPTERLIELVKEAEDKLEGGGGSDD